MSEETATGGEAGTIDGSGVRIERVHEPAGTDDGYRVLVDRL